MSKIMIIMGGNCCWPALICSAAFVRSHLHYANIIYDKRFNDSFKEILEKVQYSAALIITAEDTSWELLCQELGLESFTERRWYRELVFFYKIIQGVAPSYLQSYLLPENNRTYNTRSRLWNATKTFATRTSTFHAKFFPHCTKKWNQANDGIKKIELIKKIKKTVIRVIRTKVWSFWYLSYKTAYPFKVKL